MTPQDMQALETFLSQLVQARADGKDPQAAAMIADAAGRQPDAAYLLVQRAMLLDRALVNAQAQIASLQQQLQQMQQGQGSRSFIDDANAWGNHPGRAMPGAAPSAPPPYQAAPQYPSTPQPAPQPPQTARPGFLSGGLGGTLGSIATTAAGVAGGAMLFQGIENLFHRNSGGGFFGQPAMGSAPTETVINNYYEDGSGSNGGGGGSNALLADNGNLDSGNLDNGLDDYVDDDYRNDDSIF
ncbi:MULTISPECIES: DUF2076 domain-containing protein [Cupriavidus]|jgi:hypothetical protein|uniref:DUF2076 family protein n=1 Tax=Cupriavidus metallidurans TaxID=119219 RepID=A0A482IUM7_9BURK|nr:MULTISPECIES: DUF2076 domain-containing protein [Cupriavidus]KWR76002.1 ABC transporter substrate-binding protein [Cupriavidus sp. SHE]QBP12021.1 DUF2076 family protein [Cupriavidus metallidurans]QWC91985.1 DUF2076 family protein [Cupriavidus metallidurans]